MAIRHVEKIILPYVQKRREDLGLPEYQNCILIFDVFKGQTTEKFLNFLEENHLAHVFVPPNLTHKFQPLDLNVNAFAKAFLKSRFQEWYSLEVTNQMKSGKRVYEIDVDTRLSRMKPIHSKWIIALYDKLRNSEEMVRQAFQSASITEALNRDFDAGEADPFTHLLHIRPKIKFKNVRNYFV